MATTTWEPVQTYTVPSATTSIDFTSISQSYRHLVIRGTVVVANGGASYLLVRLNNSSSSIYDSNQYYLAASTVNSYSVYSSNNFELVGNQFQTLSPFAVEINLFNYTVTNKYKSLFLRAFPGDNSQRLLTGQYKDTSNAITQVNIISSTGASIGAGSTFTVWGLAG